MCRFLVYFGGEKILLADLITKPKHSIVHQSFCDPYLPFIEEKTKQKLVHKINGDGFGVAWYDESELPCVFTSIKPSWSDLNLARISEHVRSRCIFSHVRAASPGSLIVESNCHPFQAGRILFMHNGSIAHFSKVKKRLVSELNDYCFGLIHGTSDTEHAMALFIQNLPNQDPFQVYNGVTLKDAMLNTIRQLCKLTLECGEDPQASSFNFAVTNGDVVICTRFKNSEVEEPPSLYYAKVSRYTCRGDSTAPKQNDSSHSIVICSEPITYDEEEWSLVPKNHVIVVTPHQRIKLESIEIDKSLMVSTAPPSPKGKRFDANGDLDCYGILNYKIPKGLQASKPTLSSSPPLSTINMHSSIEFSKELIRVTSDARSSERSKLHEEVKAISKQSSNESKPISNSQIQSIATPEPPTKKDSIITISVHLELTREHLFYILCGIVLFIALLTSIVVRSK